MTDLYKIVRMYEDERRPRTIRRGLTLEQARAHCNDPATSSKTARAPRGCGSDPVLIDQWHAQNKHWFDGYERQ